MLHIAWDTTIHKELSTEYLSFFSDQEKEMIYT